MIPSHNQSSIISISPRSSIRSTFQRFHALFYYVFPPRPRLPQRFYPLSVFVPPLAVMGFDISVHVQPIVCFLLLISEIFFFLNFIALFFHSSPLSSHIILNVCFLQQISVQSVQNYPVIFFSLFLNRVNKLLSSCEGTRINNNYSNGNRQKNFKRQY